MKRCTKCGEMTPLEGYPNDKRRRDGKGSWCKPCLNAQGVVRYQANLEAPRAAGRKRTARWKARHPEKARLKSTEATRARRAVDPDYFRDWYHAHAETERARARAFMRRYRNANPEAARVAMAKYRAKHPDIVRERERENTYARRLAAPYSRELAGVMAELVTQPCAYCGATDKITVDHIVPLARGGRHEAANLAPACASCNSSKGAKPLERWLSERGSE